MAAALRYSLSNGPLAINSTMKTGTLAFNSTMEMGTLAPNSTVKTGTLASNSKLTTATGTLASNSYYDSDYDSFSDDDSSSTNSEDSHTTFFTGSNSTDSCSDTMSIDSDSTYRHALIRQHNSQPPQRLKRVVFYGPRRPAMPEKQGKCVLDRVILVPAPAKKVTKVAKVTKSTASKVTKSTASRVTKPAAEDIKRPAVGRVTRFSATAPTAERLRALNKHILENETLSLSSWFRVTGWRHSTAKILAGEPEAQVKAKEQAGAQNLRRWQATIQEQDRAKAQEQALRRANAMERVKAWRAERLASAVHQAQVHQAQGQARARDI